MGPTQDTYPHPQSTLRPKDQEDGKSVLCKKKKVLWDFPKSGGLFLNPVSSLVTMLLPLPRLPRVQPHPLVLPLGPATGELTSNNGLQKPAWATVPALLTLERPADSEVPLRDHSPGTGRRVGLERMVGHVTSMEKCPRNKLSEGGRRAREWPEGERGGQGWAWRRGLTPPHR